MRVAGEVSTREEPTTADASRSLLLWPKLAKLASVSLRAA